MGSIALLMAEDGNSYQQFLAEEARRVAAVHGLELLPVRWAGGLAMRQGEQIFECLRRDPLPLAVLLLPVAPEIRQAVVVALGRGVGLVFLNRIPPFVDELHREYPSLLVAAVSPDQHRIGVIQGHQCLALAPTAASGLLVTGTLRSPSTEARRAGLLEVIGTRLDLREIEGNWTTNGAEAATRDWLRTNVKHAASLDIVVSQNDDMALGLCRAFAAVGLACPPIIGCDGSRNVGQLMVRKGEIQATVVMPPTTPRAVELVVAQRSGQVWLPHNRLEPESYPPLENLRPAQHQ